ncbi:MAG: site-specific DNA-methyltransferase [Planctomycetes bacterium]|nr:site-specific DNA-methyltransferase [Planctomycetota bacterium]
MPTLNWIGKKAVVNHHRQVPYHVLRCDPELSVGDAGSGNLIVQGDNLLALKALLPYYAGKVKCIYIDPPYNTGNEGWIYNDNVNSPEIREWLGKTVGKEAEDLSRHDKWLCMMYPRLSMLKQFLSPDGVIFVSIGDDETHHLRTTMDEIYGVKNRFASFVWRTDGNFDNQAKVKNCHEYILAYALNPSRIPHPNVVDPSIGSKSKLKKDVIQNTIVKNGPKNPVSDVLLPAGFPASVKRKDIPARDDKWPHFKDNAIIRNNKLKIDLTVSSGWSSKTLLTKFINGGFKLIEDTKGQLTKFEFTGSGAIESIKERVMASHVISVVSGVGSTQAQSADLDEMGIAFSYPKPINLIKYLISIIAEPDSIIMDSFAGSGTTGHAVLCNNAENAANQKFILIELDKEISTEITTKRIENVALGFTTKKRKKVKGLGGGFRFCRLGPPLLDADGNVADEIKFADLARHVWFCETGEPWPKAGTGRQNPLLGTHNDTAIYLLFNGVLGDRQGKRI